MPLKAKIVIVIVLFSQFVSFSQNSGVTISGLVKDKINKQPLPYVSVVVKTEKDSVFVTGTVTNEKGLYLLSKIKEGEYFFVFSYLGYTTKKQKVLVGHLTEFLDLGPTDLEEDSKTLSEVNALIDAFFAKYQMK